MIAKKCDLCGGYYEPYNMKKHATETNGFMLLNIDNGQRYFSHNATDLCPDCMNDLHGFIMEHQLKGMKTE